MGPFRISPLSVLFSLVVLALSVHFGMTLIYLMPPNPISLRMAALVNGYMRPWFVQNWSLFAPHPISETRRLLVACRLRQDDGTTLETPWFDVSTPLWEAQARQHVSPAAPLFRLQAHTLQLATEQNEVLNALRHRDTGEDAELRRLVEALQAAEAPRQALATHLRARIGTAYCEHWYGMGRTHATRVALSVHRFPRFSQRHRPDAEGTIHLYPFAWMPYQPVAPLRTMR